MWIFLGIGYCMQTHSLPLSHTSSSMFHIFFFFPSTLGFTWHWLSSLMATAHTHLTTHEHSRRKNIVKHTSSYTECCLSTSKGVLMTLCAGQSSNQNSLCICLRNSAPPHCQIVLARPLVPRRSPCWMSSYLHIQKNKNIYFQLQSSFSGKQRRYLWLRSVVSFLLTKQQKEQLQLLWGPGSLHSSSKA